MPLYEVALGRDARGRTILFRMHGISRNLSQFGQQLAQVFLVGMTLGMVRTVIPALAESEFSVERGSYLLLTVFVVAFGFVKGTMNFVAGRMADRFGRKPVLLAGWLFALPAPWLILHATGWNEIVLATLLLGINQGLCWSATQTSKLDLAHAQQRGFAVGLDEFAGYMGVAVAGVATGYLATALPPREALWGFGLACILLAIILLLAFVRETLPWAHQEQHAATTPTEPMPATTGAAFAEVSGRDRRMFAVSQAGLVEKFVDTLVWIFYPVYLYAQGFSLADIGWIVGIYGTVWGASQFVTGRLSDRVGRLLPCVGGMWLCGLGVLASLWSTGFEAWAASAAVTGFGMALLYPNLSAAISDMAAPAWRGSAIGAYRFWRDLGYGIGALGLGIVGTATGYLEAGFYGVAVSMLASGAVLAWLGPRRDEAKP